MFAGRYTKMILCWMKRNIYLNEWKIAKIVTLNKMKAEIPQCDQTRPISLLSTHSKVFEKLIMVRK